ncbi:hypothetical protein BGX30_006467 [Mortierella sp. GBA39]|nr:hypothetical protein BGX30_006467 [Mortierella sp. GBA39]
MSKQGRTTLRLDKVLTHMGYGSRSDIKKKIKQAGVTVNGVRAKDSGMHVDPYKDDIRIDGEQVQYKEFIYLMLHKPPGVVSATEDTRDRTVLDLLEPEHLAFEPFPAVVSGDVTEAGVQQFASGVTLDDGYVTLPGELTILRKEQQGDEVVSYISLVIHEGKFHQVKRMFQAVGKKVTYLKRVQMGALKLDEGLLIGTYRELTEDELLQLGKDETSR